MREQTTMWTKKHLYKIFFLVLLFGCASNQKINNKKGENEEKKYLQIAFEKFGDNVDCQLNMDESYVLCQKKLRESELNPNELIEFFVYDINKTEIIYSDKMANVKVSWHNNTQLKIINQKGYITNPSDDGKWSYVYDLKSGKKISSEKMK